MHWFPSIALWATQMAGGTQGQILFRAACSLAAAQIDLQHVRSMRIDLLLDLQVRAQKPYVRQLRQKISRIKKIKDDTLVIELICEFICDDDFKDRPQTLKRVIGQLAQELLKLERYERRAFSGLKSAAREFEALLLEIRVISDTRVRH